MAFSDEYLYERYRFSSEGLTYLCQLLEPNIANIMPHVGVVHVPQTVWLALRYFETGGFLYAVGDAENLSKNTATCDHRCFITSLEAKWPGSVQDSRIFTESSLCHKLKQGPQTRCNVAHAKTRVKIEMTFGLLKARFTCLRGLRVAP
ncbi:hypothetical protein F7725_000815 [Dissostichus mawsoni]|uniref:DDE Tnp4 domain-containing protein n=1 Tax=Dissostichus mawsoni TaxID=36200 RepID=A0A7J5ZFZ9_DISMA|nr:hypothetical protein F7725_000815 [Dissostichus mawsoni]